MQDRRHFLQTGLSMAAQGFAGATALAGARRTLAEEAPPETTSLRLAKIDGTCLAPFDILDDVLRDEGFADVRYVPVKDTDIPVERVASGDMDLAMDFGATTIISIDAGAPAVMLAGVHPSCFELFGRESILSVVDLKGKTVGIDDTLAGADHVMLSIIAASVGSIRPRTSIGSRSDRALQENFSTTTRLMRS
jgi:NitT/TauT family transport system substrate-binding protein